MRIQVLEGYLVRRRAFECLVPFLFPIAKCKDPSVRDCWSGPANGED